MAVSQSAQLSLREWMAQETRPFALDVPGQLEGVLDEIIGSLDERVELLGFGEALHGGEEILMVRNRIFQRLVTHHGYRAIAIESSFPKAQLVDDYIAGRSAASYEEISATGFGHSFGNLTANRELVEWMRAFNAERTPAVMLRFYGFDIPSGAGGIANPRVVLAVPLRFLAGTAPADGAEWMARVEALAGEDAAWENPAAYLDPAKGIGLSPAAAQLRLATEDLLVTLRTRRPELIAASNEAQFENALQHARVARELLNFHVALAARTPGESPARVLGVRDALMAEILEFLVVRERGRGKLFAFAHNSHLQRGRASWPGQKYWGTDSACEWWPAGAHLSSMLGARYAVIGTAVGASDENGLADPEPDTLEALLTAAPGPGRILPTAPMRADSSPAEIALPVRNGSTRNPTYTPLTADCFTNFDWLVALDAVTYQRGGLPLQTWSTPE